MKSYTYDEYLQVLYGALRTLTDDEKDSVLSNLKLKEIFAFLTTDKKEEIDGYVFELRNTILTYLKFHNAFCKLLKIEPLKSETIIERYRELDKDSKFNLAFELMNEPDFQKDCSRILINNYKRQAKSDPMIGAIDKVLNIGSYFERALAQSIGCEHKYEVEK